MGTASGCHTRPASQAPCCRGLSRTKSALPQPLPAQLRPPQRCSGSRAASALRCWHSSGSARLQSTGGCACLSCTASCILRFLLKSSSKLLLLLSFQETTDQDGSHNPSSFPSALQLIKIQGEFASSFFPVTRGCPTCWRRVPLPTSMPLPQPPALVGPGVSLQKDSTRISISLRWKKQLTPLPAMCKAQPLVKVSSFFFSLQGNFLGRLNNLGASVCSLKESWPSDIVVRLQAPLPWAGILDARCLKSSLGWLQAGFTAARSATSQVMWKITFAD